MGTHLGGCEVAQPGVGALEGRLLDDSVPALAVRHVVRPHAVLAVEGTPVQTKEKGLLEIMRLRCIEIYCRV